MKTKTMSITQIKVLIDEDKVCRKEKNHSKRV